jgi:hypothetical protein
MKPVLLSTAAVLAFAAAAPAFAQNTPSVEIEHAVARVVVIVEDRTDIAVEVEQGSSGLPAIQVVRERDGDVRINGGLGRRVGGINMGDRIRNCTAGPANAARPGDGASVEVRNIGRINITDAPLIVIRSPRDVNIDAGGATYGSVGRGARSVELGSGGCGAWNVANTDGPVSLSIGGSGDIGAGSSTALELNIGGSGTIVAGATGSLEVSIGGSGDVTVARINGPMEVNIGGSGDVAVRGGSAPTVEVNIAGSGDVRFDGTAGDVEASIVGGGDVTIARATGSVSKSIMGGGNVNIGQ